MLTTHEQTAPEQAAPEQATPEQAAEEAAEEAAAEEAAEEAAPEQAAPEQAADEQLTSEQVAAMAVIETNLDNACKALEGLGRSMKSFYKSLRDALGNPDIKVAHSQMLAATAQMRAQMRAQDAAHAARDGREAELRCMSDDDCDRDLCTSFDD